MTTVRMPLAVPEAAPGPGMVPARPGCDGCAQVTLICAPRAVIAQATTRRTAGRRAVIKSPLRCAGVTITQPTDSRPTVCLCIGALRANIRICRIPRAAFPRQSRI